MRKCPVCDGERAEILHRQSLVVMDDYPLPPSFDVVLCSDCGMAFNRSSATQQDYDTFYTNFSVHQNPAESVDGDIPVWEVSRLNNLANIAAGCARSKDIRILDVGCSSGGLLANLASRGFSRLTGVDPSPVCVDHVRARGIEAYQGGAEAVPSETARFDLITLTGVLEHIEDVRTAIAALVRLCSPGGRILLEVPDAVRYADFLHSPFQDFNTEHINHFSCESLSNLMRQFGFTLFRQESIEITGPSGLRLATLLAVFEQIQEQPIQGPWAVNPAFRESLQRYVDGSRKIVAELNRQILELLASSREIIVWGTGQLAMKLLSDTALTDAKIAAFIDANPVHANRTIHGVPILSPSKIPASSLPILVTSLLHADGILKTIRDLGLTNPVVVLQAVR
ncbi:MAG: class I SAM-dependent methyltransferase [Acidobacteriaceae bacterium]